MLAAREPCALPANETINKMHETRLRAHKKRLYQLTYLAQFISTSQN